MSAFARIIECSFPFCGELNLNCLLTLC
jgi:hypothetical protein